DTPIPGRGTAKLPKLPVRSTAYDFALRRPAPRLGEHTRAILEEVGLATDEIGALASRGIVAGAAALFPEGGLLRGGPVRGGRDQRQGRLLRARADTADEAVLPDAREDDAVVQDSLDLVQELFPLLPVELARLSLEEVVDLGHDAVCVDPVPGRHRLDPR